ncbi:hypothetical protein [Flammeovirga kamogawensis]|uniref:Uncharacterized protein n=1 Tax=Flammeovirga kamogawensis TaxID=373891 RepID=A0ABX8H1Q1_9BACT|nr:hypothetical protein [Flammeovirga kamogawensis]MBB6463594.1 hypothetical protein [Flammeovirga kamogawensis]QWG09820.1 hypothetical protein KM029_19255 [Flammeovirga kamogawensis]TRX65328.1 hypothetical protein EO216_22660 [Flammeovirga kamogawensis]
MKYLLRSSVRSKIYDIDNFTFGECSGSKTLNDLDQLHHKLENGLSLEEGFIFDYIDVIDKAEFDKREVVLSNFYNRIGFTIISKFKLSPLSITLRDILKGFKFLNSKFYDAKVKVRDSFYDFNVLVTPLREFYECINFEKSRFDLEITRTGEIVERDIKNDFSTLRELEENRTSQYNQSITALFQTGVLKSAYRNIDLIYWISHGFLISDRLKEAIEAADLDGVEIRKSPVHFTFADEE